MTDTLLGLIPDYGLFVVFLSVFLGCLALPLPASLLVLAAGGFAAAGDLVLWHVLGVAWLAFCLGDQVAFSIARRVAPALQSAGKRFAKVGRLLDRSTDLLAHRGAWAVLLSHTLLSPTCAYVTYLCGAGRMPRRSFTAYALFGAAIWTSAYVGLGYVFADQLSQTSDLLNNAIGLIISLVVIGVSAAWLTRKWKAHQSAVLEDA